MEFFLVAGNLRLINSGPTASLKNINYQAVVEKKMNIMIMLTLLV